MKSAFLVTAVMLMTAPTAHAGILSMVCENPRREYVVRFDEGMQTFTADATPYRILAIEKTAERLVIVGLTINDGPTFRAHFRPYKKMEYFADSQIIQTDGCH